MIRKFTTYLFFCAFLFGMSSCNDDEIDSPPKTSVSVDRTSGLAFDDEFTFTIQQANADNVTLYPYGQEMARLGTVDVNSFEGGQAIVKFKYAHVGTFKPVVVTNNNNQEGSAKNAISDPLSVTITSNKHTLTKFDLGADFEGEIDEDAKTVAVTVPFGFKITEAKANFEASQFAKVTVGNVEQQSGSTANNFTNPVTYTVTSQDGSASSSYVVTVTMTPVETTTDIESIGGTLASKGDINGREVPAYVDNAGKRIVIYDTLGTPATSFDSVQLTHELVGDFAVAKYDNKRLRDQILNLTSSKTIRVNAQDSANFSADYTVYALQAPKIMVSSTDLNPPALVTVSNFDIMVKVLKGTDLTALSLNRVVTLPANTNLVSVTADDVAFSNGSEIDATEPVEVKVTVTNTTLGVTYTVTYTLTVTELN